MSTVREGYDLELTEEDLAEERKLVSDERKEALVHEFHEWLERQSHFRLPMNGLGYSLLLLRACRFDLERTKKLAESYAKFRKRNPQFVVKDRQEAETDETLQKLIGLGCLFPFKSTTGPRLAAVRWGDMVDIPDNYRVKILAFGEDLMALEEVEQIWGVEGIHDYQNMKLRDLNHMSMDSMKKGIQLATNACPVKTVRLHIINAPLVVKAMVKFIKPILRRDLKHTIIVHDKLESLQKYISPVLLPEEYGGTAGKLQDFIDKWKLYAREKMVAYDKFHPVDFNEDHASSQDGD